MTKIQLPLILVNFKTYPEATGKKAVRLAEIIEKASRETETCICAAPQFTDIAPIADRVSVPVFAQHVDPIEPGSFTGHILAESIKEAGAFGTLVNHSERRLRLADMDAIIERAKASELISVVCSNNAAVSTAAATLRPDMIAIEPPELIGTGIPVSKAKPEVITDTVRLVKRVNTDVIILCGAGITKGRDVAAALKLGTTGILVASGVVKAKDPYRVLLDFAEALTEAKVKSD